MCGRFTLNIDSTFDSRFQLSALPVRLAPKYSAYPGADVPIIYCQDNRNISVVKNWGMGVYRSFNARSETVLEKPTFAKYFATNRCLIPVSGFFEAKKFFTIPGLPLFSLAGIYSDSQFTILTCEPNDVVRPYHHRMPVIIPPKEEQDWLTADSALALKYFTPTTISLRVY